MWISPAEMSYLRVMETRALDHVGNAVFFARVVAETCPYASLRETAKTYLDARRQQTAADRSGLAQ